MTKTPALETRGLSKSYGDVQALRGVDLEVRHGEVFGFLGPNGSGKTTTIRCLLDLIRPTAGTARVLGLDPQADPLAVRARVGYLPGELRLEDNLTAAGVLQFFNRLRGGRAEPAFIRHLADRLGLDLGTPVKNFSKGNKQKVGVVQALMHRPELLLLDEPTSGLDPLAQQEVLRLIGSARADGATVFFSSHVLSEVQEIAGRVAILRRGAVVEVAETHELIDRALRRVRVRFRGPSDTDALTRLPGVKVLSRDDGTGVLLEVSGEMDGLIKALANFAVVDFETERPSLEDVFLAYYEGDGGEAGDVSTIFLHALKRFRGQVLGWGIVLFLMGVMAVLRYDLMRENRELIEQLVKGSAGNLIRMFGDVGKLTTPGGFLSLAFFSFMPLVLGVFVVLGGSGLLVADEENGTLDLVLAHPVSRTSLFWGRLLAFAAATLAILAFSWLGFLVGMARSSLDVGVWAIARPYLSLAAVLAFYGGLSLLLSLVLPARRTAAMTAGILLLVSFFLTTLARLDPGLENVARLSPLHYYQSGEAMDGLNLPWFAGLLVAAGLFVDLAWWRFERRDIRVVGEGGWGWPFRRRG